MSRRNSPRLVYRYSIKWLLCVTAATGVVVAIASTLTRPPKAATKMASVISAIPVGLDRRSIHQTIRREFEAESLKFYFQRSDTDPPLISDRISLPRRYAAVLFYEEVGLTADDYILLSAMVIGPGGSVLSKSDGAIREVAGSRSD